MIFLSLCSACTSLHVCKCCSELSLTVSQDDISSFDFIFPLVTTCLAFWFAVFCVSIITLFRKCFSQVKKEALLSVTPDTSARLLALGFLGGGAPGALPFLLPSALLALEASFCSAVVLGLCFTVIPGILSPLLSWIACSLDALFSTFDVCSLFSSRTSSRSSLRKKVAWEFCFLKSENYLQISLLYCLFDWCSVGMWF